jgi:hypothetical protein
MVGMRSSALQGHHGGNFTFTYMYPRICSVSGCSGHAASRFSPLCSRHRSTQHRHGHPAQTAVTVTELRQYRRKVAARREANPQSTAWSILEERWSCILMQARETLRAWESGRACVRYSVQAAHHLQAIAAAVPPAAVVEAALGMFLMFDAEPHRFRSDRAFDHQLVRRVRGLAPSSSGSFWNQRTQRVHRVYKDVPPKTVQAIAHHLRGAFASAGLQLARIDRTQPDAAAEERKRLQDALAGLR